MHFESFESDQKFGLLCSPATDECRLEELQLRFCSSTHAPLHKIVLWVLRSPKRSDKL